MPLGYGISVRDASITHDSSITLYRGLVVSDIEGFVEDVFVNEKDCSVATPEKLEGTYIFVKSCSHVGGHKYANNVISIL